MPQPMCHPSLRDRQQREGDEALGEQTWSREPTWWYNSCPVQSWFINQVDPPTPRTTIHRPASAHSHCYMCFRSILLGLSHRTLPFSSRLWTFSLFLISLASAVLPWSSLGCLFFLPTALKNYPTQLWSPGPEHLCPEMGVLTLEKAVRKKHKIAKASPGTQV